MEKKNNTGVIIIITVICTLLVSGTCFYLGTMFANKEDGKITINKDEGKDKGSTKEENNDKTEEVKDNNKEIVITDEMQKKAFDIEIIEKALKHFLNNYENSNILSSEENRIIILQTYYLERDMNWTTGSTRQESLYASYADFEQMYNNYYGDIFGKMPNVRQFTNFVNCDYYESLKDGDYLCWIPLGINPTEVDLDIENTSLDGNVYTLTGEMEVEVAEMKDSEGTFEIKYLVKNNDIYLQSIVFDITKEY